MRFFRVLICCILFTASGISHAVGDTSNDMHTAEVREVLKSGGYTFILCREKSLESWIATLDVSVDVGDIIEYPDGPPTYNFESETLGKRFQKIYFVAGIRKEATKKGTAQSQVNADQTDVYQSVDDGGTLVFTDDPAKLPANRKHR